MQPGPHAPSVAQELKHLTRLLKLTTEQQTQVKVILTDQHQQIEALLHTTGSTSESDGTASDAASGRRQPPSREAMEENRAAMDAIHETTRTTIAAVLDDEQKTKFAAWEKQHERPDRQSQNGEMPPPPPSGEGGPAGF
jgi:Spy/CpxP family protein refolding chaperone